MVCQVNRPSGGKVKQFRGILPCATRSPKRRRRPHFTGKSVTERKSMTAFAAFFTGFTESE